MNKKLNLILGIALLVLTLTFISAESTFTYCAEKTTVNSESAGAWCQPVVASADCNASFQCQPTSCEETSYCKLGTCVDLAEGECAENKAKIICENSGGVHYDEPRDELPQCAEGCCFFGKTTDLMTGIKCSKLESVQGIETIFDTTITDYFQCIDAGNPDVLGACTFEENYQKDCEMLTKKECQDLKISRPDAQFNKDFLCTAPGLLTKCYPSQNTFCDIEEDKVYFLDTCDNKANVYDATKFSGGSWDMDYWTKIIKPEDTETCVLNLESDGNQLTCGNCEYFAGSTCATYEKGKQGFPSQSPEMGENICKNINCPWIDKGHGDSWCISNAVEEGLENAPGSNWAVQSCYDGELIIEPCPNGMRETICLENETRNSAGCVENRWKDCIEQEDKESCENIDYRDCDWLNVESEQNRGFFRWEGDMPAGDLYIEPSSINAEYVKGYCVPKNASGFTFWNVDEEENICSQVKVGFYGQWKNYWDYKPGTWIWGEQYYGELNSLDDVKSLSLENEFVKKTQNLCSSLGDCEVKINYFNVEGESTSKTKIDTRVKTADRDNFWKGWIYQGLDEIERLDYVTLITCQPWSPPRGGSDCEKCNSQETIPCTQYQCKSLGARCEFEEADGKGYCYDKDPSDVSPPRITLLPEYLTDGYSFSDEGISSPPDTSVKIIYGDGDNCVPANKRFSFKIQTDKLATCKFNTIRTPTFEEMGDNWFDDSSGSRYNHTITLLPLGEIYEEQLYGMEVEPNREYNLFVRCESANGVATNPELNFNFCVDDSPDTTQPRIYESDIDNGASVGYNVQSINVTFYLDDEADCRWDRYDRNYEDMENNMTCKRNSNHPNILVNGQCEANFTGLKTNSNEAQNDFYIRCKDQPNAPQEDRNTNSHSLKYTLYGSVPLNILPSYTQPFGILIGSSTEREFIFEVKTALGSENGFADCYYRKNTSSSSENILFSETGETFHSQPYWRPTGSYNYTVDCFDSAGNMATEQIVFEIELDDQEPIVTRAFKQDEYLRLITNEPAKCAYSTDNCNYGFLTEGITNISTVFKTEHNIAWDPDKDFYIKCKDEYNNYPPSACTIIIKPSVTFDGNDF